VIVKGWVVPAVCVPDPVITSLLAGAGETTTVRSFDPEELIFVTASFTAIVAVSALNSVMLAPTELTPLAKVTVVAVPKLRAVPVLSVTVGAVTGLAEGLAPENVSTSSPLYDVAVLPSTSFAVIVSCWLVPAVCTPDPVIVSVAAGPDFAVSVPESFIKVVLLTVTETCKVADPTLWAVNVALVPPPFTTRSVALSTPPVTFASDHVPV
jgi:hypothetical protein